MRLRNPLRRRPTEAEIQQARDDVAHLQAEYQRTVNRWMMALDSDAQYEAARGKLVDAKIRLSQLEADR